MGYDKVCREIGCNHFGRKNYHRLWCPKHPDAGKIDPFYQKILDREEKRAKK